MLERLLLYLAIFIIAFIIYFKIEVKKAAKKGADKIIRDTDRILLEKPEYKIVTADQFPWLDINYYIEMEKALKKQGFEKLADVENISVSSVYPDLRTFTRIYKSSDGTISASVFQIKPKGIKYKIYGIKMEEILSFGTEFSNGDFMDTSNASERASHLDKPEQLIPERMSKETPVIELLNKHKQRIDEYLKRNPGVQTINIMSLEDHWRSQERLDTLMINFRKVKKGLRKQELERIAGNKYLLKDLASSIGEEIEKRKDINN